MSSLDSFYSSVIDSDQKKKIKISPIGLRFDLQEQKERKKIFKNLKRKRSIFGKKKNPRFWQNNLQKLFFRFLEMKIISKWQFSSYYGKRTRWLFTKLLTNVLRWSFGMVGMDQGPYSQNFTFFITY